MQTRFEQSQRLPIAELTEIDLNRLAEILDAPFQARRLEITSNPTTDAFEVAARKLEPLHPNYSIETPWHETYKSADWRALTNEVNRADVVSIAMTASALPSGGSARLTINFESSLGAHLSVEGPADEAKRIRYEILEIFERRRTLVSTWLNNWAVKSILTLLYAIALYLLMDNTFRRLHFVHPSNLGYYVGTLVLTVFIIVITPVWPTLFPRVSVIQWGRRYRRRKTVLGVMGGIGLALVADTIWLAGSALGTVPSSP